MKIPPDFASSVEQCLRPRGSPAAPGAGLQLGVSPAPRPLDQQGKKILFDGTLGRPVSASQASAGRSNK